MSWLLVGILGEAVDAVAETRRTQRLHLVLSVSRVSQCFSLLHHDSTRTEAEAMVLSRSQTKQFEQIDGTT